MVLTTQNKKKGKQDRLDDFDVRMSILAEEKQLETLEQMKNRMMMHKDYVDNALQTYDEMRPIWNDIVIRRDTAMEEYEEANTAYKKFKENLEIQGIDTTDF